MFESVIVGVFSGVFLLLLVILGTPIVVTLFYRARITDYIGHKIDNYLNWVDRVFGSKD